MFDGPKYSVFKAFCEVVIEVDAIYSFVFLFLKVGQDKPIAETSIKTTSI